MSARNRRPLTLVLLLLAAVPVASRAEAPFSFAATPGKLPKTIAPKNYSIRLQPDLENFTTHGTMMIDLDFLKPTREIVLNVLDLEITNAFFALSHSASTQPPGTMEGEPSLKTKEWLALTPKIDTNRQTLSFSLPADAPPGRHRLFLEFTGHLREQEQGFFYVKYNSPSGKKIMLATQMEATDARRMFPCWDEPVFRASFDLSVVLPAKLKSVSNMPAKKENLLPGALRETRFARTPAMASYLVVLVCGELEE